MADSFAAISEDGVRFKLRRDGTWEPDTTPSNVNSIQFRSSGWGESPAKVKASEMIAPLFEDGEILGFETSVGGFPVIASFHFVNGLLHLDMYKFKQEHADENKFIDDFYSLQSLLTTKYGKPEEIQDIWSNDLFRDDYEKRGMAVSRGDHAIFIIWQDDDTKITLQITGDNYEISLAVIYRSKRLESLARAASEREKLAGF